MSRTVYWSVTLLLIAFGFVAILSIGAPFFFVGITMAVLSPFRGRPRIYWSGMGGVLGLIAGYVLVAPLSCTATASGAGDIGHTTCTNLLGIDYSGTGVYNPPLVPALLAGLGTAVLVGYLSWRLFSRGSA